jgi:molybdate transport system ATP-binding protein
VSSAGEAARIAAIHYERGFDVDDLLITACARLRSVGLSIGGIVQASLGERGQCASSVHAIDLRNGEKFDIWEKRGSCARGCRLDERGLIDAESAIMTAIAEQVDLLVINRFGRAESPGRGLVNCFRIAIEADIIVLTAVRPPYGDSWAAFRGGLAQSLLPELRAIRNWCLEAAVVAQCSKASVA